MTDSLNGTAARYHRETKYTPQGLMSTQRELDWASKPSFHKTYHQAHKTDLCAYVPFVEGSIAEAAASFPLPRLEAPVSLEHISRLLYFCNGVTRVVPHPGAPEPMTMRAAPSAGALYPTEIYVVSFDVVGLEQGVFNFQIRDHSLVRVWDGDFRETLAGACLEAGGAVRAAPFCLVLTGCFDRSAWRYHERAYRRILLDTGHVLGNALLYAPSVGLSAVPLGGFVDEAVSEILLVDIREEAPLLVVPCLPLEALERPEIPGARSSWAGALRSPLVVADASDDGADASVMASLHAASVITEVCHETGAAASGIPAPLGEDPRRHAHEGRYLRSQGLVLGETDPAGVEAALEVTILARRSTRSFTGEGLTAADLARLLEFAYAGETASPKGPGVAARLLDGSLIDSFVAVSDVAGIDPGIYYYVPTSHELRPMRSGVSRETLQHLSLGQELGRDAAVQVLHLADLVRALERYGERAYRYLHLDAGHLGQRLNLACVHLGLGVSGIGGFFDDEVGDLLGLADLQRQALLYITTIGQAGGEEKWV